MCKEGRNTKVVVRWYILILSCGKIYCGTLLEVGMRICFEAGDQGGKGPEYMTLNSSSHERSREEGWMGRYNG
jgi:hypothetical protein